MVSTFGMLVLGLGLILKLIAVAGVIKFSDFYSRVHAAGIVDSAGMVLVLSGLSIQCGISVLTLKVIVLICLLLVTNTTMCNILTNAACDDRGDSMELGN